MFNKRKLVIIIMMLSLLVMSGFLGCSSKSVSDEVTGTTSLSVSASPPALTIGETSVVEANLTDGTVAIPNQELTFTVEPSSAGYFSPVIDTTNVSGIAATVFTSTTSGTATITVSLSGSTLTSGLTLTQTTGITISDEELEGTGNIDMTVSPSLLIADGEDTSHITITVRDASGAVAPDSTPVFITAGEKFDDIDGNGYFTESVDSVIYDANANGRWDAIGFISSVVYTSGGNGIATVDFISGFDAKTVYIKATVNNNGISGNVESSIQLNPNATISSIFLISDSLSLSVKQTGGVESGIIRAHCYDYNADPVPEGLAVSFFIISGPNGDEHLGNVGWGPFVAKTNSQGVATATLHSGTISGTVRIRAASDTVLSNASQVLISAGPPYSIQVGSQYCNSPSWEKVGWEVIITAVVSDTFSNPVNDSTVVYFWTDEGVVKSHEERTQEWEGIAKSLWFSGQNGYNGIPADGRVWIYAETAGGTVVDSVMFYNSGPIGSITAYNIPASLPADGISTASILVEGLDINGNPVPDATVFRVDVSPGGVLSITDGSFADGCHYSTCVSEIVSNVLSRDYSLTGADDDGIGAVVTFTYSDPSGSLAEPYTLNLTTTTASRKLSTIDVDPLTADYNQKIYITIEIEDSWGNPLGDHTINLTATAGALASATAETDANGEATFILTAPNVSSGVEEIFIVATDTDPLGNSLELTKKITITNSPTLSVSPPAIDFGAGAAGTSASLPFDLFNSGEGGTITYRTADNKTWISLDVTSGSITNETDQVTVTIDRTGLAVGTYDGTVTISSDAGNVTVTIGMEVI